MNSGVQQDLERNHRRAFCLPKKQGKSLEVQWHATGEEVLKFRAVRYRGSYNSVRGAQCHWVTIPPTFRRKAVLWYSVSSSPIRCEFSVCVCVCVCVCYVDATTKQTWRKTWILASILI